MPNRKEHNKKCREAGIDLEICDAMNYLINEPSQVVPGCKHREERHDDKLCNEIYIILKDFDKKIAKQAKKACKLHIKLDKNNNRCAYWPLKKK